jgi:phosphohistidine phosphatase
MPSSIILLRHGESADKQTGQSDFDRTLTDRGRHAIEELGLFLIRQKIFPDVILSSNAVRTTQTSQVLLESLERPKTPIIYDPVLYYGHDLDYKSSISKVEMKTKVLVVVGHNPTISSLIGDMTGNYSRALLPGQAAFIDLNKRGPLSIEDISGKLLRLIGPFLK